MSGHADLLAILALALVAGKLAGNLGQRFGLPTPVGKISVGLLLGPAAFGLISDTGTLSDLSAIGVVLLMFLAGLETDTETMRRVSLPALAVAAGGVVLPFAGGVGIGLAFDLKTTETLFLGAILTATSVSISAQTLRELGRLRSKEGSTILAAAVIDDVLGIIVLAFVFALTSGDDPLPAIGKMALFLPLAYLLGFVALGPIRKRAHLHLSIEAQLSVAIAVALTYAWAAERLGGVAAVTGAYMAGLLIARTDIAKNAMQGLTWVGYSFFVPLFFVGIGLQADFRSLGDEPLLAGALLGVAVVGKVVGCYVAARLCRFSHVEALRVGVGMMSRGEVALVIAAAGLGAGAVDGAVFSASVLMALVTTVLTPVLLKLAYPTQAERTETQLSGDSEAAII